MARIGILTLYATGHTTPSLALAQALAAAGHQPVFFNLPDTASAAEAAASRLCRMARRTTRQAH